MKKEFALVSCLATLSLAGCASELLVYSDRADPTNSMTGIPVPVPGMVLVTTTTTYEPKPAAQNPELCATPVDKETYDFVPSGSFYYVNFDPSQFSNSGLTVAFNDKGLASSINVNSEASTGSEAINSLIGTVLPYFETTKAAELEAASKLLEASEKIDDPSLVSAEKLKEANCLVKKVSVKVAPLVIGAGAMSAQ